MWCLFDSFFYSGCVRGNRASWLFDNVHQGPRVTRWQGHWALPFRGLTGLPEVIEWDQPPAPKRQCGDAGSAWTGWDALRAKGLESPTDLPRDSVSTSTARFRVAPSNGRGRLRKLLDRNVVGQVQAQQTALDFIDRVLDETRDLKRSISVVRGTSSQRSKSQAVLVLGIVGPPSCGKTVLRRAITEGVCGDAQQCVLVDGPRLHDLGAVARLFGVPPGFVGHTTTMESETFAPKNLRAMAADPTDPLVIVLEEPEKAEDEPLQIVADILARFAVEGTLEYPNAQTFEHRNVVLVVETEDAEQIDRFMGYVRRYFEGTSPKKRSLEVLRSVLEPLKPKEIRLIAERAFHDLERRASEALVGRDAPEAKIVSIKPDSDILDLLEEAVRGDRFAARKVKWTIEHGLIPVLGQLIDQRRGADCRARSEPLLVSLSLRDEKIRTGSSWRAEVVHRLRSQTVDLADLITVSKT